MGLNIYNTLSWKKEPFVPVKKGKVHMYVCGMTVYSDAHVGHARTYVTFDVIRRYFEYKKYKVTYIQNITDVDDKIITAANKEGIDPLVYAQRFTERCLGDLDLLGVRRADMYPKASETIADMIKMIEKILEKKHGYVADGDVYFSVGTFPGYGRLSGQNIKEMRSGTRNDSGEGKRNPLDFALWKKAKPGEPTWHSPWGDGRPGWHIECSVMSSKYLGLPFDIHGGGMDLRFPHHENEIAQTEAATGKPFARFWMHVGLLTINGQKMSKSLGNIINIRDILKKWDAEVIRMFFAQAHYRSPPDFSERALADVEKGLARLYRVKEKLEEQSLKTPHQNKIPKNLNEIENQYMGVIQNLKNGFEQAMDDDFNTPKVFAFIFEFVTHSNKFLEQSSQINPQIWEHALDVYLKIGSVVTLFQSNTTQQVKQDDMNHIMSLQQILISLGEPAHASTVEELLDLLIQHRKTARKRKDWKTADIIRKKLQASGFEIQDTATGTIWRKKKL